MLHEFLAANRIVLIAHCRDKAAKRYQPSEIPAIIDHGVPLFLQQLVSTLQCEQSTPAREVSLPERTPAHSEIGQSAALHGAELLRLGYSIDQVVHDYGDLCQAITELAVEESVAISADEFRTLNRCLDSAIADAVTAYGAASRHTLSEQAESMHTRLRSFVDEHRRLVDIAIQSYAAIKTGCVGLTGATGNLLLHTLDELSVLAEHSLPEIQRGPAPVR